MTRKRVLTGVIVIVALVGLRLLDRALHDPDRYPPDHIGIWEGMVDGPPEACSEVSDRWGCSEPGRRVTFGFFQGDVLVAQQSTFDGARFRVELPEGEYDLRVIRPKGTYASPTSVTVGGGAIQRSSVLWPLDKKSFDELKKRGL